MTSIVDKEPEIEPLNIKSGSILDYIPTYNELFNNGKSKVFPMQSLEQVVNDPLKYEHTLRVVKKNVENKKKLIRTQKMLMQRDIDIESHKRAIESVTGQTIGSKYRFQKSSVSVADLNAEIKQSAQQEKDQKVFDLELYLDIKKRAKSKAEDDKRAVEKLADDDERDLRREQI